jgi:putative transcriptional regulator
MDLSMILRYQADRCHRGAVASLKVWILCIRNDMVYKGIMSLHNRIAVLRAEKKISRAALASSVGVNPQTIGFLERGDYTPSLELAFRIAGHFGLPVEAVFSPRPFRTLSEQVYKLHKREA